MPSHKPKRVRVSETPPESGSLFTPTYVSGLVYIERSDLMCSDAGQKSMWAWIKWKEEYTESLF